MGLYTPFATASTGYLCPRNSGRRTAGQLGKHACFGTSDDRNGNGYTLDITSLQQVASSPEQDPQAEDFIVVASMQEARGGPLPHGGHLELYDVGGRIQSSKSIPANQAWSISLSPGRRLPSGIYFVRVPELHKTLKTVIVH